MNYLDKAKKIQEEVVNWRRALHKIPEVGRNLKKRSRGYERKHRI